MGGNVVSKSYKMTNTTDLEVTTPDDEDSPSLKNGKSVAEDGTKSFDTSIPLEGTRDADSDDAKMSDDEDVHWHGLPMGVNENGSFVAINVAVKQCCPPSNHHGNADDSCYSLPKRCHRFCLPCSAKHNQSLATSPSRCGRLRYLLLCPPHGLAAGVLLSATILVMLWATLWAITGAEALPGGNLFALYVIIVLAAIGGKLIELIHLPALLGMLLVGFMFKNIPGIQLANDIDQGWSSALRNIALAIILIKAGLGIDAGALRRLSLVCARLATLPCLAEAIAVAVVAHLLLDFGWDWAFMLGFVIAAVSPAVVVPSVLQLQDKGYGVRRGVPTLIVAAASCENVFAIAAFGVALGIAFPSGCPNDGFDESMIGTDNATGVPAIVCSSDGMNSLAFNIFRAPIELIMGVAFGCLGGMFLWYIPDKNQRSITWKRSLLVCSGGSFAVFGSAKAGFTGAGAMGCLILSFVAAQGWGRTKEPVSKIIGLVWVLFEPILFSLIGAAVSVEYLDGKTVGLGIAVMSIGLVIRIVVTLLVVCRAGLDLKSKGFAALAWIPKATVQAAIGPLAWEVAREKNAGPQAEKNGVTLLTLAVLSILLTAPIGAILIALGGPRLLERSAGCPTGYDRDIPEVKIVAASKEASEEDGGEDETGDGERSSATEPEN